MSAQKHLLRWKGRQNGPFALDEIRSQLKGSEIGLMHEVQVEGQWMTIEKFLAKMAPRPSIPPISKQELKSFGPPTKIEEPRLPVQRSEPQPPPPQMHPPTPPAQMEQSQLSSQRPQHEMGSEAMSGETLAYGGFWLRYAAAAIDGVIISAISWAFAAMALMVSGETRAPFPLWLTLLVLVLYLIGGWIYFALMESSEIQATLGKLAVGLIVTDLAGERITFSHATGRYFGKVFSALTVGVGYFMAAFTDRKQALHDVMAGCHVLLRLPPSRIFQL
jgi:uncharacterized RDD family membrane protein YckC